MKKMTTITLPAALTIALGQYYLGRAQEQTVMSLAGLRDGKEIYTIEKGKKWDKAKSLKVIDESTKLPWSASAGTFWFTINNRRVEVTEDTWPLGNVCPKPKKQTPKPR